MVGIKELSKKMGCTINDVLIAATSSAFKQYFKMKGDPIGSLDDFDKNSAINAFMPANIRFDIYPTRESVRSENIFACLPFTMPLVSSMKKGYKPIKKLTTWLKFQGPYIYLSYAMAYWGSVFFPRFLPKLILHNLTMKATIGFSNVAGPIKAWHYTNGKNEKCFGRWCHTYVCLSGKLGICVSCISYADNYKVSVLADEEICPQTRWVTKRI